MKPFFYGGPAIALKLSCEVESEGLGSSFIGDCDELPDGGAESKSFDYGLVVGGGLAFGFSGNTFTLGARYNHGMANIAAQGDTRNRVLSVLATFEFPWGTN